MNLKTIIITGVTLVLGTVLFPHKSAAAEPHRLVENFTDRMPHNASVRTRVVTDDPHRGLAHARLDYELSEKHRRAQLFLPDEKYRIPGPGRITLLVRGEDSRHTMRLCLRHAEVQYDRDGNRRLRGHKDVWLEPVSLDFNGWREVTFDVASLPEDRSIWWRCLRFSGPGGEDAELSGTVMMDEFRLFPAGTSPKATLALGLLGPDVRSFSREVAVFVDARNFARDEVQARARVVMTDRNENLVVDRDFILKLQPGETRERKLALRPDRLEAYLPPFRITCDVASDVASLTEKADYNLVMGNSVVLFENFADLHGRWFTAGTPHEDVTNRNWSRWLHGQAQRYCPFSQTNMRISRVRITETESREGKADPTGAHRPMGRYAMKLDYDGAAAVYSSRHRYLPGNPYRLGVWVRGDGSGAELWARFLDYTDSADFWPGGWKRIRDGGRRICRLDFEGWRYLEVSLPGNGLGRNTTRGSTDALDFPLELTAFRVLPGKEKSAGSVLIGPIFVHTQQPLSETLAVHAGYDDPERRYAPERNAHVTIHSSRPPLAPGEPQGKVRTTWTLLDRAGDVIATDSNELELSPGDLHRFSIDLSAHAEDIATRRGPLRLQVVATNTEDVSVSGRGEIILSKPDSLAFLTGFESDRGYLGLKARGIENITPAGTPAAVTSDGAAHSGERSLALPWEKQDERPVRAPVSVDPMPPGIPTELTMWVHGDGSGVLFYPLVGDRKGVSHGAHHAQWDLFLPRTEQGEYQNVVRVDWKGWKQLTFRLPGIPPDWNEDLPVLGFEPSYPLGIHLVVAPDRAKTESGLIYVDDISVRTHLNPEERLDLSVARHGMSNIVPPGAAISVTVANHTGPWLDGEAAGLVKVTGGIYDWRGRRVTSVERDLQVAAASRSEMLLSSRLPVGAYRLRLEMSKEDAVLETVRQDLLVADLEAELGADWTKDLEDRWALKEPLGEDFARVDEDWDWVEHHPGNLQLVSLRHHINDLLEKGGAPHVLLGYSAYWAAGPGFEDMQAASFRRRRRDAGHAVDIFMVPERLDDWSIYTRAVMRGVGRQVHGWILWNNPDGSGPLAMKPGRLAELLKTADRWRRRYSPETPIFIGGMNTRTAIPYLNKLKDKNALKNLGGVNVRMDVGRLSPEDARVPDYVQRLQRTLGEDKRVLLTDLDWAVEKGEEGLGVFDQAAYVARAYLLLDQFGIRPVLSITNPDTDRLGLGLTYRRVINVPPLRERPDEFLLKPGWWAVLQARRWMRRLQPVSPIEVQDVVPDRTRCLLYRRKDDDRAVAVVWRVNDPGEVSFETAGFTVSAARDLLGTEVSGDSGWYSVGKMPAIFVLEKRDEQPLERLKMLRVREGETTLWPQRVISAFDPGQGTGSGYEQSSGEFGRVGPTEDSHRGISFAEGGRERFTVQVPRGGGLILRKRYYLGEEGQLARVKVNGRSIGTWDLRRRQKELSSGVRTGIFVIPAGEIEGQKAQVELRYEGAANTLSWWVMEYRDGVFPMSAVGPVHADQNVGELRYARNMVGAPLQVVDTPFRNGIGTYARSLIEYSLNGQFRRFRSKVGIDAVTDGKGSVVFEVHADGKKIWSSGVMSGLDEAKEIDLSVEGVNRLRLIVTDAGDGNRYDAADWCEPVLER